jgi:hypothetical protein
MNVCLIVFSNYLKTHTRISCLSDQASFTPSQEESEGYGGSHELHMR